MASINYGNWVRNQVGPFHLLWPLGVGIYRVNLKSPLTRNHALDSSLYVCTILFRRFCLELLSCISAALAVSLLQDYQGSLIFQLL